MTLVEISEREVLAAAKAWRVGVDIADPVASYGQFAKLYEAVGLLIERERVEQSLDTGTGSRSKKSIARSRRRG